MAYPDNAAALPALAETMDGAGPGASQVEVYQALITYLNQARARINSNTAEAGSLATNKQLRAASGSKAKPGITFWADSDSGARLIEDGRWMMQSNQVDLIEMAPGGPTVKTGFTVQGILGIDSRMFAPGLTTTGVQSQPFLRHSGDSEVVLVASLRALKQNERTVDDGLAIARQLQPTRFDVKDSDPELRDGRERVAGVTNDIIGFIADDVAEVDPSLVTRKPDGSTQGIHDPSIVSVAIAAIKELDAKVADLEDRLATYEGDGR